MELLERLKAKVWDEKGRLWLRRELGGRARGADPDEKWANLYREREKNNLYKWVGFQEGGELLRTYDEGSDEAVIEFADKWLVPCMYNEGRAPKLVRQPDFARWKRSLGANLGDEAAEAVVVEDQERPFPDHVAQWKLNKRGVDGETLIHLLLKRSTPKTLAIARILLREFPGLAGDIYLGEETFGESPLHQAIVLDDYDLACLLVEELGVNVEQRATGRFFLPEDMKAWDKRERGRTKRQTDYRGSAYYGEYPLAFAASFGNKDIYDLLISNGADPNQQDCLGNTVLHMCVINNSSAMYGYAVRHWEKPADVHIVNSLGYTPLTLASKLGRKDIFEEMLELMKVEFWRFSDMACSAYPLTVLDTISPDGSTNWDSALMTIINGNSPDHLDMITSQVIQRLLADKWKAYGQRKLFERLFLLAIHLFAVSVAIYHRPGDPDTLASLVWERGNVTDLGSSLSRASDEYIRLAAEVGTCLICIGFLFYQQVTEIRTQGLVGYVKNLRNAPAKGLFLLANLFIILCIPCRVLGLVEWEEGLLVLALPTSWFFLLFFARGPRLTGPFVQMIYSMIAGDIFRFAIISLIFLVSFSQAFYFLGKDMNGAVERGECDVSTLPVYTYTSFTETFMTLFRASMGGYDYEEFACAHYAPLTKSIFVLYMVIMPIMLINMLIAMMGNTYTTVISQAEKAWRQQLAQIIIVLERAIGREKLARCQTEYSIKLSDPTPTSDEVRGLMVIKQTRKTKAKQRKTAVASWKRLGKKVKAKVQQAGGWEKASALLHSHSRMETPQPGLTHPPTTGWGHRPTTSLKPIALPPFPPERHVRLKTAPEPPPPRPKLPPLGPPAPVDSPGSASSLEQSDSGPKEGRVSRVADFDSLIIDSPSPADSSLPNIPVPRPPSSTGPLPRPAIRLPREPHGALFRSKSTLSRSDSRHDPPPPPNTKERPPPHRRHHF